jgi:hypothetical protein
MVLVLTQLVPVLVAVAVVFGSIIAVYLRIQVVMELPVL